MERHRLIIEGVVQGVGFRPFVYNLATSLGLTGWVSNNSTGVIIEAEGEAASLVALHEQILHQPPPLARIERCAVEAMAVQQATEFTIVPSTAQAQSHTLVSPDLATCEDCLRELFTPTDHRYRYPFINCTHCGPRYTIIRDLPYDRPLTTMAPFTMCVACQAEYDNPRDRRFHAQPNACPTCGPRLTLQMASQSWTNTTDALNRAKKLLAGGAIVAVKGLGGYHLACDATNETAVQHLRQRKGRDDKPFALMVASQEQAEQFALLNDQETALLTSRERPIVLLKKQVSPFSPWERVGVRASDSDIASSIAPGNGYVGVMLPYTPLHHLLLEDTPILVMTSANVSGQPIITADDDPALRLLADAVLSHDRAIETPCDDSVIRVSLSSWERDGVRAEAEVLPIRRSRGYAPFPVRLPMDGPSVLAVGGELKSTFCVTKGHHAFMSQHIGDMANWETLETFRRTVEHVQRLFRTKPTRIVVDQHPGYLSRKWAMDNPWGLPVVSVQHHHAHLAGLMAEHGLSGDEPIIGFSFDGTGYGSDGTIWGGELLQADYDGFTRLRYVPLPGGDAAIKRPYRTALAQLWSAGIDWADELPPVAHCPPTEQSILRTQLSRQLNTVQTSSMGRLFDVVSALCGVRQEVSYEGQAAIEFEAVADPTVAMGYDFGINLETHTPIQIDPTPMLEAVVQDVRGNVSPNIISAKFHNGLANLILDLSRHVRTQVGLNTVGLSGGVFQNITLLQKTVQKLTQDQFKVLTHRLVPPNDGGLALGQAMIGSRK